MPFNGLEIDMLAVANGDCIFVTHWEMGYPTRIMIDGGNANSLAGIRRFLRERRITRLDHIVCTHPDNDHAAGLLALIEANAVDIGQAWFHVPHFHLDVMRTLLSLKISSLGDTAGRLAKSLRTAERLHSALSDRRVQINEPFAGARIGPFEVCGPTQVYYERLIAQLADPVAVRKIDSLMRAAFQDNQPLTQLGASVSSSLLDNPSTTPLNNGSVILRSAIQGLKIVLTGDAGTEALYSAIEAYDLSNCAWLQIPHHGSRHNIDRNLIAYFRPRVAYVSAAGSVDHPRRAVVNAFSRLGTKVFSTHWLGQTSLYYHIGEVPARAGYTRASPLYDLRRSVAAGVRPLTRPTRDCGRPPFANVPPPPLPQSPALPWGLLASLSPPPPPAAKPASGSGLLASISPPLPQPAPEPWWKPIANLPMSKP